MKPTKRAKTRTCKRTNWKRRALLLKEAIALDDEAYDELERERDSALAERDDALGKLRLTEELAAGLEAKLAVVQRQTPTLDARQRVLAVAAILAAEVTLVVLVLALRG